MKCEKGQDRVQEQSPKAADIGRADAEPSLQTAPGSLVLVVVGAVSLNL